VCVSLQCVLSVDTHIRTHIHMVHSTCPCSAILEGHSRIQYDCMHVFYLATVLSHPPAQLPLPCPSAVAPPPRARQPQPVLRQCHTCVSLPCPALSLPHTPKHMRVARLKNRTLPPWNVPVKKTHTQMHTHLHSLLSLAHLLLHLAQPLPHPLGAERTPYTSG
jgi:hypothetical protein